MSNDPANVKSLAVYRAWDLPTRWFHWINVLCIIVLAAIGTGILFEHELGFSPEGIILMKTVHVYAGYVFVLNLLVRILWAFVGSRHARWAAILPVGRGYLAELKTYAWAFSSPNAPAYVGHNPLGRLMVGLLLALMLTQAVTGLVLASTDLYKPPFGGIMAEWVTGGDADKLANLKPGSKEFIDQAGYDEMRAFRKPFKSTHEIVFYILVIAIALHIFGVVYSEARHRHGIVSAMFSGQKVLPAKPVDGEA